MSFQDESAISRLNGFCPRMRHEAQTEWVLSQDESALIFKVHIKWEDLGCEHIAQTERESFQDKNMIRRPNG